MNTFNNKIKQLNELYQPDNISLFGGPKYTSIKLNNRLKDKDSMLNMITYFNGLGIFVYEIEWGSENMAGPWIVVNKKDVKKIIEQGYADKQDPQVSPENY